MRRLALLIAALSLLAATGCGKNEIVPDKAAQTVDTLVANKTGFQPKDTTCPDGVEAKEGGTFDCHFTGPEGPYVAHMTITKVDGSSVQFQIQTARAGN
jgi:hypothetical protein